MGASSVTGKGPGASNKPSAGELAVLSQGPAILIAGLVSAEEEQFSSPTTYTAEVVFPHPLPGGADDYVVMLTPLNGENAYIASRTASGGHFRSFTVASYNECDVMYMVVKAGVRAI